VCLSGPGASPSSSAGLQALKLSPLPHVDVFLSVREDPGRAHCEGRGLACGLPSCVRVGFSLVAHVMTFRFSSVVSWDVESLPLVIRWSPGPCVVLASSGDCPFPCLSSCEGSGLSGFLVFLCARRVFP
jgi:hypothetical protein